jgi:hypothetical protein
MLWLLVVDVGVASRTLALLTSIIHRSRPPSPFRLAVSIGVRELSLSASPVKSPSIVSAADQTIVTALPVITDICHQSELVTPWTNEAVKFHCSHHVVDN